MSNPMIGKIVRLAVGTRESLYKLNKNLIEVEMYVDGESGTLYVVPKEDKELQRESLLLNDTSETFANLI